jgi:hypothetical protein
MENLNLFALRRSPIVSQSRQTTFIENGHKAISKCWLQQGDFKTFDAERRWLLRQADWTRHTWSQGPCAQCRQHSTNLQLCVRLCRKCVQIVVKKAKEFMYSICVHIEKNQVLVNRCLIRFRVFAFGRLRDWSNSPRTSIGKHL